MNIPKPIEGDVDIGIRLTGTGTFQACWVLTAIVGVALLFRFAIKVWVRWALPQVTAPGRVWGIEDLFFLVAWGFDITHMVFIQMSANWGLGRHFFYLTGEERLNAMKWDFLSQPMAVTSAMISRAGMMWFLLTCFAASDKIRKYIIICAVIQAIVNMVAIVQIIVQCGPNPYQMTDRVQYFHYMWMPLPEDGSVQCQSPAVQMTIGFVQGGFNTVIDFFLAVLAAVELWQFFLRTLHHNPNTTFWSQFCRISGTVRSRRIWQTITLSGPLVLSGCASAVKTYKLKSLGDRQDFTYNIVTFVLWVKIENYSILLASCAPVARLFLRSFVDQGREGRTHGYWSRTPSTDHKDSDTELKRRANGKDQWLDSTTATNLTNTCIHDEENPVTRWNGHKLLSSRASKVEMPEYHDDRFVTVKTDIVVQIGNRMSTSSGGTRLLPNGGFH
ncbi:hypothetical protein N7491_006075 [Penicillium cf. griseofulvum]|uniref:Rhodopsin domain-containing protein n=1 Tax=Penicillium cf. griseofulvum TaxID=2972120 RepID=A0A9W9M2C8_9EURO|nr:hypothetical protein N7472_010894 [Penicillium cf. griseofulvum]KAJ5429059.1 hypothetical protein N7491_006075 [Penicillium cf. griseofulvum]KAJ5437146.1 hypothetical protein N7445_008031 [Penicillium cf. griseofulvum]